MGPRIAQKHSDPVDPSPDPDPQRYFVTVCGVDVRLTKFIILKFNDSTSQLIRPYPYGNNTNTAAYVVAVTMPISPFAMRRYFCQ